MVALLAYNGLQNNLHTTVKATRSLEQLYNQFYIYRLETKWGQLNLSLSLTQKKKKKTRAFQKTYVTWT